MNKKSPAPALKPQANKKINKRLVIFLAVGCVIIVGITAFLVNYNRNYAAEVAAPIEKELIKAGAVKKCSSGSTGREFLGSNLEPYYASVHLVQDNLQVAAAILERAAQKSGYNLVHATLNQRGPITVADEYVDKWYFDIAKPKSPFSDLKDGIVRLTAKLDLTKDEPLCGNKDASEDGVIVDLRIKLPEQKWRLY